MISEDDQSNTFIEKLYYIIRLISTLTMTESEFSPRRFTSEHTT